MSLRKDILLVIFSFFLFASAFAKSRLDSLLIFYQKADDFKKGHIAIRISVEFDKDGLRGDYIEWLHTALNLSLKVNDISLSAYCYDKISEAYYTDNILNPDIRVYSNNALRNYKLLPVNDEIISNQGNLYLRLGNHFIAGKNFTKSKFYEDSAKQEFLRLVNTTLIGWSKYNMATYYIQQNDFDKALFYAQKCIEHGKAINDKWLIIRAYRLKTDCFLRGKEIDNIINVVDTLVNLTKPNLEEDYRSYLLDVNMKGKVLMQKSLLHEAILYINESLKLAEEKGHLKWRVINLYDLGNIYYRLEDYIKAEEYTLRSLDLSLKHQFDFDYLKNLLLLVNINKSKGDKAAALKFAEKYIRYKDSLNAPVIAKRIVSTAFSEELQAKEMINQMLIKENKDKEADLQKQITRNTYLLIISVLFFLMLGYSLYLYVKNKKKKEELLEKNVYIEEQNFRIASFNEELLATNENLNKVNDERKDLMAIVSHDLQAPLNRAFGLIQLFKLDEKNLSPSGLDLLKKLLNELEQQKALITDILRSENLELEYENDEKSIIDLSIVLPEILSGFYEVATKKGINLVDNTKETKAHIFGSRIGFQRIIDNLVSNAIKFSDAGTVVEIKVTCTEAVEINVKDQGQGFSESDFKNLFKKFHKLSSRPTAGEVSTGLGLAIVKTLVEKMDGKITLISEKGKGSEFILTFPKISAG